MRSKWLTVAGVLVVIALGIAGVLWYANRVETIVFDADRTIEGDFAVLSGQRVVLAKGAKLTVTGNLAVDGELSCQDGGLQATVGGELRVSSKLTCLDQAAASGIAISAKTFTFEKSSVVVSAGSIQLVDRPDKVLVAEQLEAAYQEVEKDSGSGQRVGPLRPDNGLRSSAGSRHSLAWRDGVYKLANVLLGAQEAGAQAGPKVTISGRWQIVGEGENAPRDLQVQRANPKIKHILLNFHFGEGSDVRIQDLTLSGPEGSHGENAYDACTVLGGNGGDAMRLNVNASNVTVNNFTLTLGDGGAGGIAKTSNDCDRAYATGGNGGKPGNFKMVATGKFEITGAFEINPGRGGEGGLAEATGKNGEAACGGKKGGDAEARGGKGGDSLNVLGSSGTVGGLTNVSVGDVMGGRGGDATANGGKGGDGSACGCAGGTGGKATAVAGQGGQAAKSGSSWAFAVSEGGNGGNATANAGMGGTGGSCGPDKKGGNGGNGGDSSAKPGKGGAGADASGADGSVSADNGGNGGTGGDGCLAGAGGNGGMGLTAGSKGKPGKTNCIIEVIKPKDKYLITGSLHIAEPDACGEKHWHGNAVATDGSVVPDPNPSGCGHCALSQCPVVKGEIAPPYVSEENVEKFEAFSSSAAETSLRQGLLDFFRQLQKPSGARIEIRGGIFGN